MSQKKKKTALMTIKKFISKEDCRATLAFIVTVGGLIVIGLSLQHGETVVAAVTPTISMVMMLVLEWYFKSREKK